VIFREALGVALASPHFRAFTNMGFPKLSFNKTYLPFAKHSKTIQQINFALI
jgi:hypothetical protein